MTGRKVKGKGESKGEEVRTKEPEVSSGGGKAA
jgi:hypothetical protein